MAINVKLEKSFAEFLNRFDSVKYEDGEVQGDFQWVLVKEECDDWFSRQSGLAIEEVNQETPILETAKANTPRMSPWLNINKG